VLPQIHLLDLSGPTSKGREGMGRGRGKEGVRKKERGGREKGGESVPLALILHFDH